MEYFFITMAGFALFFLLMSVGVLLSNKAIKGSCGGIGTVMGEENKPCEFCGKTSPCESDEDYQQRMQEIQKA